MIYAKGRTNNISDDVTVRTKQFIFNRCIFKKYNETKKSEEEVAVISWHSPFGGR